MLKIQAFLSFWNPLKRTINTSYCNNNSMNNDKPSVPLKKGIKVYQPQTDKCKYGEQYTSNGQSIRSSRSRGISMSRETGINLDRIYQPKHFIPAKNNQEGKAKQPAKSLVSYKSQQLISSQNDYQAHNNQFRLERAQIQAEMSNKKTENKSIIQKQLKTEKMKMDGQQPTVRKNISQINKHPNIITF